MIITLLLINNILLLLLFLLTIRSKESWRYNRRYNSIIFCPCISFSDSYVLFLQEEIQEAYYCLLPSKRTHGTQSFSDEEESRYAAKRTLSARFIERDGFRTHFASSFITLNIVQYDTIQYNTIQYNTIQYNTIQCNAIQYNTILY